MAHPYYAPCPEFDECNRLIDEYYRKGLYKECFDGHLILAQQGYPLAECQVGYFYQEGLGTEKDLQKAFYWTRQAALHGDRDSQCNLAQMYWEGAIVPRDPEKAREWFLSAIRQGNDYAERRCRELGIEIE